MNNATTYPSCIKIPTTNSKQNNVMVSQKFDLKEVLTLSSELIALANRIFGERKWNHSITNQTIDFIEPFMGKYVCGCATFVKIQLKDGTFHEDMAYYYAEGATKGLTIHTARITSLTEAFKKTLSCFGSIESDIEKLINKSSNSHINNNSKENVQCPISSLKDNVLETFTKSESFVNQKIIQEEDMQEIIARPESQCNETEQAVVSKQSTKSKSPIISKKETIFIKNVNGTRGQQQSNDVSHQKGEDTNQKKQEQQKALNDEEILRMERKRKQMEKQAEYKRLMKEKEQLKTTENNFYC
ncbi:uncharacterized protein LOC116426422 isoform X3 [Nomia melanderi]|uniref:uncharacterized protein LOC116426422 isoform X3 n=1 Tax=Nomia melanderi TaxID=2448451 RepID=UPI00130441FC|nr:DNA repair and recombination protein RAD52 isoform X3 [Nomia melanderi]